MIHKVKVLWIPNFDQILNYLKLFKKRSLLGSISMDIKDYLKKTDIVDLFSF